MAKFMTLEGLQYLWTQLKGKLADKVDREAGKGLSANDYTTIEKNKLQGIAAGANNYTHPQTHPASMITDLPTKLPADGGDAETVGGHTVEADVPIGAKFTDTIYTHPSSGITEGVYRSVEVNEQGHVVKGTNPTTLSGYGITDAAQKQHIHDGNDIISFDASKLTGIISMAQLPEEMLEGITNDEIDAVLNS